MITSGGSATSRTRAAGDPRLKATVSRTGATCRVAFAGDLGPSSRRAVRAIAAHALRGRPRILVLDIREVASMDLDGHRAVNDLTARAAAGACAVVLVLPPVGLSDAIAARLGETAARHDALVGTLDGPFGAA
jgi:hypothetical protein